MVFNNSPSVLVVKAGGRVELPYDLVGRKLVGHSTDVALNTFGIFAALARIDPQEMTISTTDASMATMLKDLVAGKTDAVFGYNSTIRAAAAAEKINPDKDLKFFEYEDLISDCYGSAIMVRRSLLDESPQQVRGLLRAVTRGLRDAILQPDCRDGRAGEARPEDRSSDRESAVPEHPRRRDVAPRGSAHRHRATSTKAGSPPTSCRTVEGRQLKRVPGILEVFNRDYLPPINERITSLGR